VSEGAGQQVSNGLEVPGTGRKSGWRRWLVPALVIAFALVLLLPGLDATGLWTLGELPVLDRTLAALGEPRSNLTRSPWLPDQLRTWAYAATGNSDVGLRLPGALACVGLVGLTVSFARRLGWSDVWAALAGGFALALPLLLASGRTVLGNPTGELWIAAASLALVSAADRSTPRGLGSRVAMASVGVACLLAAVASMGIVIGGCLPLLIVAVADVARSPEHGGIELPHRVILLAWAGAAAAGFVGLWLGWSQGQGYIPLLGAAKDLQLLEDPTSRTFTDTLESLGYQLFPFTGLIVFGLLAPGRARWPSLWLGVALVMTSIWALSYGPTPTPVTIPAALLATAATQRMLDRDEPISARRLVLVFAVLAALVLGKDAARTPAHIASPLLELALLEFPQPGSAPDFDVHESLPRLAKRFAALLLLAHLLAPPSGDQQRLRERVPMPRWLRRTAALAPVLDRMLTRVDETRSGLLRLRTVLPLGFVFVALGLSSWSYGRTTLTKVGRQMSIAGPLERFATAVDRGDIPDSRLSLHRVRDPGLDHYGPGSEHEVFLANRSDLDLWLAAPEPRTALIRRSDLPPAFSSARVGKRPLFVLDAEHHEVLLVSNFLPPGYEDQNPLLGIVYDEPISLANETLVVWDPFVELIAWEIDGELHRGSSATLHMVFRVNRPLPAGTQMYARLQKGKVSRVAAEPHELTGGAMPPNFWRAGDYVHHRFEFEVPWLEVLPGEHELIVGLRRSETSNMKITTPTEGEGAFGVQVRGSKAEFATIWLVDLDW
jgi:hypothetical protein